MPSAVQSVAERLCRNVERVLVGKHSTIQLAIVALLCEGHLLLEDVPGIGKTTLARAVAQPRPLRVRPRSLRAPPFERWGFLVPHRPAA